MAIFQKVGYVAFWVCLSWRRPPPPPPSHARVGSTGLQFCCFSLVAEDTRGGFTRKRRPSISPSPPSSGKGGGIVCSSLVLYLASSKLSNDCSLISHSWLPIHISRQPTGGTHSNTLALNERAASTEYCAARGDGLPVRPFWFRRRCDGPFPAKLSPRGG